NRRRPRRVRPRGCGRGQRRGAWAGGPWGRSPRSKPRRTPPGTGRGPGGPPPPPPGGEAPRGRARPPGRAPPGPREPRGGEGAAEAAGREGLFGQTAPKLHPLGVVGAVRNGKGHPPRVAYQMGGRGSPTRIRTSNLPVNSRSPRPRRPPRPARSSLVGPPPAARWARPMEAGARPYCTRFAPTSVPPSHATVWFVALRAHPPPPTPRRSRPERFSTCPRRRADSRVFPGPVLHQLTDDVTALSTARLRRPAGAAPPSPAARRAPRRCRT